MMKRSMLFACLFGKKGEIEIASSYCAMNEYNVSSVSSTKVNLSLSQ